MSDDIRVQGNLVSWGSYILKIDGQRWYGITKIDWDHKRERSYGYGMGKHHKPIGRTAGKYTPGPVKLTMHKHTGIALRKYLMTRPAAGSGVKSFGNVEFSMLLQIVEGTISSTAEFDRCVNVSKSGGAEETADPSMEEWELSCMGVHEDGGALYDSSEGV